MEQDSRPLIRRPEVLRQIAQVALVSLAISGVILSLLWRFVGPPSYDAVHHDHNCWRCLDGISMAVGGEGWAISDAAFFLHYTHNRWDWQPALRGNTYYRFLVSVAMASEDEGWAVGDSIIHYGGGRWTQELDLSDQTVLLTGVAAAGPEDAWAVGGSWYNDFGFIWRYQDGAWSKVINAPNMDVVSVAAPAVGDAWAVAIRYKSEGHPSGSSLLHYRDGTWIDALDTSIVLGAIVMTSPMDGWATGRDASGAGIFLHFAGGTWTQAGAIPDTTFDEVSMTSSDEGWASGTRYERGAVLYRYSRGAWAPIGLPVPNHLRYILGISTPGPGEMWALGIETAGWRDRGVLLHYQDGRWSTLAIPKSPPEDMGQVIETYGLMGFWFFALVGLMWAWGKSFRAPRGSDWRHWLTRVILAGGVFLVVGHLIAAALPLFADDLPVDPSRIATVAEYGLIVPAMALQLFTQPAAWIVGARRRMRSHALPTENAREMEIHRAGTRND